MFYVVLAVILIVCLFEGYEAHQRDEYWKNKD